MEEGEKGLPAPCPPSVEAEGYNKVPLWTFSNLCLSFSCTGIWASGLGEVTKLGLLQQD